MRYIREAMWHWDQGHLAYYQFDALRRIASFAVSNDLKIADRPELLAATGLPFKAPATHSPWRNYSRALKLSLLVSESNGRAVPTPVAKILSTAGAVTCDEYLHFLIRAFTEPTPALENWTPNASFRYPLLFALKYLLTKAAILLNTSTTLDEIVGGYLVTGFTGEESNLEFIRAVQASSTFEPKGKSVQHRQANESLRVIAQISYLYMKGSELLVSLDPEDASAIFEDLEAVGGPRAVDREAEIRRLADLFSDGSTSIAFEYPNSVISEVEESGFREGSKAKKTHVTIERNSSLRREFFVIQPTSTCDVCSLDTLKTYPWTERVLDLHHLLPLCSGTRVEATGTTFADVVPVCPSCHRAIHRFYDQWLKAQDRKDFADRDEARLVYETVKSQFPGAAYV